jgi:outer membrane protein assembly factor BamE (lipoprotein component of BamABCDE complex)
MLENCTYLRKYWGTYLGIAIGIAVIAVSLVGLDSSLSNQKKAVAQTNLKILELKLGMKKDEVIELLGPPEISENETLYYRTKFLAGKGLRTMNAMKLEYSKLLFDPNDTLIKIIKE